MVQDYDEKVDMEGGVDGGEFERAPDDSAESLQRRQPGPITRVVDVALGISDYDHIPILRSLLQLEK